MAQRVNNERSEAIELIKLMDGFAKKNTWQIKSVGGESTLNTGKKRMFPDVIIYGDNDRTRVLQGWEIKMPDVPITDEDFIKDAQRKADTFGVNSCVTWNFSDGVLYIKENDEWKVLESWRISKIKTRADVSTYKAEWSAIIEKILREINNLFETGKLLPSEIGELTSNIYSEIIERNKSLIAENLRTSGAKSTLISAGISIWWKTVEKEYAFDENDMYSAYAKYVLLNWLNKLTFANLIKSYHDPARTVESINVELSPSEALKLFDEITNKCDFYNIFSALDYAEYLPQQTWSDLTDYNALLIENNVSNLPQETLQMVLERSIDQFKRNATGLFATPTKLAKVLVGAGVTDLTKNTIDPCCGTGTIAKEILNAKIRATGNIEAAYKSTFASDKYSFPLQVSNISMMNANAIRLPALLFKKNAFELAPGSEVEITNPSNGNRDKYRLPLWGNLASNLPFVAFDQDGREEGEFIPGVIKKVKEETKIILSGKGDLYQALLLSFWDKLADGASVAVITSNSWLGTVAGLRFFEALNMYYEVNCVVSSGNGKWFSNADVVTVMLFLSKKKTVLKPSNDHTVYFGLTNKKIETWADVEINDIINSILLKKELPKQNITFKQYTYSDIQNYILMNVSLNALFYNIDWLPILKDKLCPITDLFDVVRGMKTAQDDIYYLKTGQEIDAPYIGNVLKSAKNIKTLIASADTKAFVCDKSKAELCSLGHKRTLDWIKKFEGRLNKSMQNKGTFWNNIADGTFPGSDDIRLFTGMNPEQRIFYGLLDKPAKINQRVIGFIPHAEKDVNLELCHALLNSVIGVFYTEAVGFPKGLGALDNCSKNVEKMFILNPSLLSDEDVDRILSAFQPLLKREIMTTQQEYEQSDRRAFEEVVADCFGYSQYFKQIKDCVLEMQRVRLSVRE